MTETLEARAEVLKLARLLERDPDELGYLERVPAADLRRLRDLATDRLFSEHGVALARFTAASRVLPAAITASLAQRAFGPLLSARIAGALEPSRAVDVAAKLPASFLAQIAIEMDPRRAQEVIARIPPAQIADVTAELVRNEEYVTMGRFVGHIAPGALDAALAVMSDRDLLHIAFVIEDKEGLDQLLDDLGRERLGGVIGAAAGEDLWPEALDLVRFVSDAHTQDIASAAAGLDEAAIDSLAASVIEHDLFDELFRIAERMSDEELHRVAPPIIEKVRTLPEDQRAEIADRLERSPLSERLGPLREGLS